MTFGASGSFEAKLSDCEQLKKKEARGLCKLCYNKEQRKLYPENGEYMV